MAAGQNWSNSPGDDVVRSLTQIELGPILGEILTDRQTRYKRIDEKSIACTSEIKWSSFR